jgi:hypothetical protein
MRQVRQLARAEVDVLHHGYAATVRRHPAARASLPVAVALISAIGCAGCAGHENASASSSRRYYGEASYQDGVTDTTSAAMPTVVLPGRSGSKLSVRAVTGEPLHTSFASRYLKHGDGPRVEPTDSRATIRFAICNWKGTRFSHNTWADPGATPVRVDSSTPRDVVAQVYALRVGDIMEFTDRAGPAIGRSGDTQVVVLEIVNRR